MLLDTLTVGPSDFAAGTGWEVKPEGACRAEVCVPLPPEARRGEGIDVEVVADRLGMPIVADEAHGLFSIGPATLPSGRALSTAIAPELELPDLRTGEQFRLSSLRGQKVLLLAWASW